MKEKYENVAVHTNESLDVFKAQLFALTNVPVERQKILTKGKQLKVRQLSNVQCTSPDSRVTCCMPYMFCEA